MKRALSIAALLILVALIGLALRDKRRMSAEVYSLHGKLFTTERTLRLVEGQRDTHKSERDACRAAHVEGSDMQRLVSPRGMKCRVTCTVVGAAKGSGMAGKR